jgi:hypothetical protein
MRFNKRPEYVNVTRPGGMLGTMFALTARRPRGARLLRKLFDASWLDGTMYIDHRYVEDVIAAVGGRVKFLRT